MRFAVDRQAITPIWLLQPWKNIALKFEEYPVQNLLFAHAHLVLQSRQVAHAIHIDSAGSVQDDFIQLD